MRRRRPLRARVKYSSLPSGVDRPRAPIRRARRPSRSRRWRRETATGAAGLGNTNGSGSMLTQIWLTQPLAFARVGASPTPSDAFMWNGNDLTPDGSGQTTLAPAETINLDAAGVPTAVKPDRVHLSRSVRYSSGLPVFRAARNLDRKRPGQIGTDHRAGTGQVRRQAEGHRMEHPLRPTQGVSLHLRRRRPHRRGVAIARRRYDASYARRSLALESETAAGAEGRIRSAGRRPGRAAEQGPSRDPPAFLCAGRALLRPDRRRQAHSESRLQAP